MQNYNNHGKRKDMMIILIVCACMCFFRL